jgi:hypothetical protein
MYNGGSGGGYGGMSSGYGLSTAQPAFRDSASPAYRMPWKSEMPSFSYGSNLRSGDQKLYAHGSSSSIDDAIADHKAYIAHHSSKEAPRGRAALYVPGSASAAYLTNTQPQHYFAVDSFLKPGTTSRFVGDAESIQNDIEAAFLATTGDVLPRDIQITVLNDAEFRKAHAAHDGGSSQGVMGFSLNANGRGISRVFVRATALDHVMLTVGHEIGHVLTPTLRSEHDEEAKAFAFSLAWMNAIRRNNIAGIGSHILPEPAQNGLHDRAFAFVQAVLDTGVSAWEAFLQLAKGALTITEQPMTVEV